MTSYKERLNKIKNINSDPSETIVRLMKYFGWSWQETMDLPIPAFLELTKIVTDIEKKDNPEKLKKK